MRTRKIYGVGVQILRVVVLMSMQSRGVMSSSWNVSCCQVYKALSKIIVERTGSIFSEQTCQEDQRDCMKHPMIQRFVNESRDIVPQHMLKIGEDNIQFHIESDDSKASILVLMVFAFVGKTIQTPSTTSGMNKISVSLKYDTQTGKIMIERDSCEFDKTLYSSMVLGSVTLLIFFISAMVIEKKKDEQTKQKSKAATHQQSSSSNIFVPVKASTRAQTLAFAF